MKSFYNITILFALVIVYINTHAQSITFEKTFGEPYPSFNEGGSGALQTYDSGYIVLGQEAGDGTLYMGVMLFFKTDSLGDSLWTGYAYNYFGGKFSWGYDMAITPDSGLVMFGMKVRREIKIKFVTLRPKDEKNFINRKTKKS